MKIKLWVACCLTMAAVQGCSKFLDEKTDKSLSVGASVADLQALLDYTNVMNLNPLLGDAGSDDYYIRDADWNALDEDQRNNYTWNSLFTNTTNNCWYYSYRCVYYANTALEKIQQVEGKGTGAWNNVHGSALFFRGLSHYKVALFWANTYDSATAASTLGIPLRLNSNFNEKSNRSTLQASFDQIISDLKESLNDLPSTPTHVLRPSKEASFALLSQIYLYMGDYRSSILMADSSLMIEKSLLNYNLVANAAQYPFTRFSNPEIIFDYYGNAACVSNYYAVVDSSLYKSYSDNDLRKKLYYRLNTSGLPIYCGSYEGMDQFFAGAARDELYLNEAECHLRLGDKESSLQNLNTLLRNRYKKGTFTDYGPNIPDKDLMDVILSERRKELAFRDIRWMDIKRLNRAGANIDLKRFLNGQWYSLDANSKGFALPIPSTVVEESGIQQN